MLVPPCNSMLTLFGIAQEVGVFHSNTTLRCFLVLPIGVAYADVDGWGNDDVMDLDVEIVGSKLVAKV